MDQTQVALALGYPHSQFFLAPGSRPQAAGAASGAKKGTGNIMILSKNPLELIEHPEAAAVFYHGLLHVRTAEGVHVLETHMSPQTAAGRIQEANMIAEVVRSIGAE